MESGVSSSNEKPNWKRVFYTLEFLAHRYSRTEDGKGEQYVSVNLVTSNLQRLLRRSIRGDDIKKVIQYLGSTGHIEIIDAVGGLRCRITEKGLSEYRQMGESLGRLGLL